MQNKFELGPRTFDIVEPGQNNIIPALLYGIFYMTHVYAHKPKTKKTTLYSYHIHSFNMQHMFLTSSPSSCYNIHFIHTFIFDFNAFLSPFFPSLAGKMGIINKNTISSIQHPSSVLPHFKSRTEVWIKTSSTSHREKLILHLICVSKTERESKKEHHLLSIETVWWRTFFTSKNQEKKKLYTTPLQNLFS